MALAKTIKIKASGKRISTDAITYAFFYRR